jgi:hypothetical protein
MNERVVPKMTNFCVVKLSNSPAITCVSRLELDHFELQPDSLRINQRLLKTIISPDQTLLLDIDQLNLYLQCCPEIQSFNLTTDLNI